LICLGLALIRLGFPASAVQRHHTALVQDSSHYL
jgi:hypothetical protein